MVEDVGRTVEAPGEFAVHARIATPEPACRITVLVVPFRPATRELAELVAPGTRVPGLGDELDVLELCIIADSGKQRMVGRETMRMASEYSCEIEAKSVDAELARPVTQAVDHQRLDLRVIGVERVAGARVVDVGGRVMRFQAIVGLVVQAAEADRRPVAVAFTRMVENDVEDHFHPRIVNSVYHLDEFAPRIAGCEARHRREECDRVIAPVIAQAALRQMVLVDVGVDRHELNRADTQ